MNDTQGKEMNNLLAWKMFIIKTHKVHSKESGALKLRPPFSVNSLFLIILREPLNEILYYVTLERNQSTFRIIILHLRTLTNGMVLKITFV